MKAATLTSREKKDLARTCLPVHYSTLCVFKVLAPFARVALAPFFPARFIPVLIASFCRNKLFRRTNPAQELELEPLPVQGAHAIICYKTEGKQMLLRLCHQRFTLTMLWTTDLPEVWYRSFHCLMKSFYAYVHCLIGGLFTF